MKAYFKRFAAMVVVMAGAFALVIGGGWLIAQAAIAFGWFGLFGGLSLIVCALAAACTDSVPPG